MVAPPPQSGAARGRNWGCEDSRIPPAATGHRCREKCQEHTDRLPAFSNARSAGKRFRAAKPNAQTAIPRGPGDGAHVAASAASLSSKRTQPRGHLGGGGGGVQGFETELFSSSPRVEDQSAVCGSQVQGAPAHQSSALESTHPRRVESTRSTWLNKWRGQEAD